MLCLGGPELFKKLIVNKNLSAKNWPMVRCRFLIVGSRCDLTADKVWPFDAWWTGMIFLYPFIWNQRLIDGSPGFSRERLNQRYILKANSIYYKYGLNIMWIICSYFLQSNCF